MADEKKELQLAEETGASPAAYAESHEQVHYSPTDMPKNWRYKQIKLGSWKLPWYASPKAQLFMVAMVCFMCPGMFNALGGMGGGGKADATTADDMVGLLMTVWDFERRTNRCA